MATRSLAERFANVANEYPALKRRCEERGVSWRWATWAMFGDAPYYFERNRWGRGRWLSSKPAKPQDNYEYGFDAEGRVVVEREWIKVGDWPLDCKETFFEYGDGVIESAHFNHGRLKTPINVRRRTLKEGRVVTIESHFQGGNGVETVTYDEAGLPKESNAIHHEPNRPSRAREFRYAHDDLGKLILIEENGSAGWSPVFQKPSKGQTPKALAALVEARLLEWIPKAVAAAKVRQPVYCLLLAYDWENPSQCLPPLLALGLESERKRFVEEHGEDAASYLWNPAELEHFDTDGMTLTDGPLLRACELYTQQLAQADRFAPVLKLLVEVARKLNARDWSRTLDVTDDFLVVPVDLEGAHVKRHLAAVRRAPAAR